MGRIDPPDHGSIRVGDRESDDRVFLPLFQFDLVPTGIDVVFLVFFPLLLLFLTLLLARLERVSQVDGEQGAEVRVFESIKENSQL